MVGSLPIVGSQCVVDYTDSLGQKSTAFLSILIRPSTGFRASQPCRPRSDRSYRHIPPTSCNHPDYLCMLQTKPTSCPAQVHQWRKISTHGQQARRTESRLQNRHYAKKALGLRGNRSGLYRMTYCRPSDKQCQGATLTKLD